MCDAAHNNPRPPLPLCKAAELTVAGMLSFGVVANYLWLGRTEFVNHAVPFDFVKRLTPPPLKPQHNHQHGPPSTDTKETSRSESRGAVARAHASSRAATLGSGSDVGEESDCGIAGPLAERLRLVYTADDFWAPPTVGAAAAKRGIAVDTFPSLCELVPRSEQLQAPSVESRPFGEIESNKSMPSSRPIPHAFGVKHDSSEAVAIWTANYLEGIVRKAAMKNL